VAQAVPGAEASVTAADPTGNVAAAQTALEPILAQLGPELLTGRARVEQGDVPPQDKEEPMGELIIVSSSLPAARGPRPRQRQGVDPTTVEIQYSAAELEFLRAMDEYKRLARRPFPTWHEVLEVLLSLGYRQVAGREPLPLRDKHPLREADENAHTTVATELGDESLARPVGPRADSSRTAWPGAKRA
jgi:hypothetical protein